MNASVKAVGIVVGLWAGASLADEWRSQEQVSSEAESTVADAPGTGGSGDLSGAPPADAVAPETNPSQLDPLEEPATGGSADPSSGATGSDTSTGAADPSMGSSSGTATDPSTSTTTPTPDSSALQTSPGTTTGTPAPTRTQVQSTTTRTTTEYAAAPAGTLEEKEDKKKGPNLRGLQVMLGGGVEGYTGSFASRIDPGPAYGLTVAVKPTSVLGIELGYSGAVNEISGTAGNTTSGADIVRNGAQAVATFGMAAVAVQPYILGGVGLNWYDVRAPAASGFRDDTSGNIPLGAGLRAQLGPVAADLRVAYNVLFSNDFAAVAETNEVAGLDTTNNGGRYTGMLQVGSNF